MESKEHLAQRWLTVCQNLGPVNSHCKTLDFFIVGDRHEAIAGPEEALQSCEVGLHFPLELSCKVTIGQIYPTMRLTPSLDGKLQVRFLKAPARRLTYTGVYIEIRQSSQTINPQLLVRVVRHFTAISGPPDIPRVEWETHNRSLKSRCLL